MRSGRGSVWVLQRIEAGWKIFWVGQADDEIGSKKQIGGQDEFHDNHDHADWPPEVEVHQRFGKDPNPDRSDRNAEKFVWFHGCACGFVWMFGCGCVETYGGLADLISSRWDYQINHSAGWNVSVLDPSFGRERQSGGCLQRIGEPIKKAAFATEIAKAAGGAR